MTEEEQRPDEETPAEAPEETPAEEPSSPEETERQQEQAPDQATETDEPPAPTEGEPPTSDEAPTGEEREELPGAGLEPIAVEERELSAEERARLEAEAEERARMEAAATAEAVEEEPVKRKITELDASTRVQATGKRKRSVARVLVRAGGGKFLVNDRPVEDYFPKPTHQITARQPLTTTGYADNLDVQARVHGGGISGQAGAISHGIARALTELDPELRRELKQRGLLRRDARVKERRKAGLKKARKRPQFSKR